MVTALAARINGSSIELFDPRSDQVVATVAASTTAVPANAVAGIGSGYKVARGVASVTGSGDVVTGLATVVAVTVTLRDDAALTGHLTTATIGDQAGTPAAGSVTVKVWKPTADVDCTPIAATAAKSVNWIAVGT